MVTAETTSQENTEIGTQESPQTAPLGAGKPVQVEPDMDFIRALSEQVGSTYKKCYQCGTCSATCELSLDREPFPRKEMVWAGWGLKDRLLTDPDVWLCHQCNDCSTRCPRGARPGDVLAAVRKESVLRFAYPRFLARWVSQPKYIPLLLGIPAVLLGLALLVRDPIENALGISQYSSEKILYSYSSIFPHWLLNSFFMFFSVLVFLAVIAGVRRFWRALTAHGVATPAKGLAPSIVSALKNIFAHNKFTRCTTAQSRFLSHAGVFFGFIALTVVTVWVITGKYNPLIQANFVYPFGFWNPLKILANLGGLALVAGCLLMIRDRLEDSEPASATTSTYFDWALIGTLLAVVLTGFMTEVLHYARLEPHRHIAYFIHLVFVFALLMYLPYSKFAHLIYRTTAMVYAEYSGRNGRMPPSAAGEEKESEKE